MSSLLCKSKHFWRLSGGKKWTLLQAWCLLLVAHTRLEVLGFSRTLRWASGTPSANQPPAPLARTFEIRDLEAMASRNHLLEMTCLRQALVTCKLLSRAGVASVLKLGVRQEADQIGAHAWLEVEGETIKIQGAGNLDYTELRSVGGYKKRA